ncbi:hypothetical protein EK21DRAFT_103129 [Setomelanomma holmii]|uniref:Domain of unknown function at the cortex 1 domain-containing protein n=1 Tax=Setomelanomma holmii TaxID=210430 RepID=A0A9P4H397_9PLEO|nr:hypothetical protein EK21DRAFT_103129 [Setomelanomma holmii]
MGKDSVVDPAARDKYLLQVTAGPTYDQKTHQEVPVNGSEDTCIESDALTCWLKVRIKDYHGLPRSSPSSSPYFTHKLHTSDRYSVAWSFVPKRNLSGRDVVLGFDYDHSIKHQLPPGFKYAMKIATSMLDPGLYSDPYSDNPYLYGPALSGLFTLNIGDLTSEVSAYDQLAQLEQETGGVVEEGATGSGKAIRDSLNLPPKWKKRRKHFLTAANLEKCTFEKGRMYHADFFNPYLDFANFSLRLPGFSISIARYIDEKTHHLRYVMKDRSTDEVLFVVFFKLLFGKELETTLEARTDEKHEEKASAVEPGEGAHASHETEGIDIERPEEATKSIHVEEEKPAPQPQTSNAEPEADEDDAGYSATGAVTSLSNGIYAAMAAMGFWDDGSSSSGSEATSRSPSKPASSRSMDAQVDDMSDATVEKYLKSRQGNVQ